MKRQENKNWITFTYGALFVFSLAVATVAISIRVANSQQEEPSQPATQMKMKPATAPARAGVLPVKVTEHDFDEQVLKANVPVLVDFWAEWCGPCHLQAPILNELAREVSSAKIAKVEADENPQLAERYKIQALPTLLVFKNGQEVARHEGVASKEQLKKLLSSS